LTISTLWQVLISCISRSPGIEVQAEIAFRAGTGGLHSAEN
jgi:hypothetical protein